MWLGRYNAARTEPGTGSRDCRRDDAVTEHGERQESGPVVGRGTATDTAIADWSDRVVAYRGYDVLDLVRESTFTEVAFLLLCGDLPDDVFLADFRATYGSIGAVVVFLMWIYVAAYAVFFGAALATEAEIEINEREARLQAQAERAAAD